MGRTSPKWPVLCRVGRKTLTQSCKTVRNYTSQQQPFYGPLSRTTRVSRYEKKHSPMHPPSRPSSNLYQLLPSTTIYRILPVPITCLAIFLHNLSPCLCAKTSEIFLARVRYGHVARHWQQKLQTWFIVYKNIFVFKGHMSCVSRYITWVNKAALTLERRGRLPRILHMLVPPSRKWIAFGWKWKSQCGLQRIILSLLLQLKETRLCRASDICCSIPR